MKIRKLQEQALMMTSHKKKLFKPREACVYLHGDDYTEGDRNRLYRMIKNKEITAVTLGSRYFIPAWQLEKLVNAD